MERVQEDKKQGYPPAKNDMACIGRVNLVKPKTAGTFETLLRKLRDRNVNKIPLALSEMIKVTLS